MTTTTKNNGQFGNDYKAGVSKINHNITYRNETIISKQYSDLCAVREKDTIFSL